MAHQFHVPEPRSHPITGVNFYNGWLVGILSVTGFAVALYVAIVSAAPSYSLFSSMSVFP
jgi:hypothetical protein